MNIFYLHPNPRKCAQMHCDKHVVKMIVEATQLLYTCHYLVGSIVPSTGYKKTHPKHPCSIWLTESIENYLWTIAFAWELAEEYRHRYGLHKLHTCEIHLVWLERNIPSQLPIVKMTPPRLAMKPEYKVGCTSMDCYRYYYIVSKDRERKIVKYTNRKRPDFLDSETE